MAALRRPRAVVVVDLVVHTLGLQAVDPPIDPGEVSGIDPGRAIADLVPREVHERILDLPQIDPRRHISTECVGGG
jgi:hypothetical protein